MTQKRLKSSIVLGLGVPGSQLVNRYDQVIRDRYFLPQIEYPNFLTESIIIGPSSSLEEGSKIEESIEIETNKEDSAEAILEKFSDQSEKLNDSLRKALNRVTDASKRVQFEQDTGLEIKSGTDVFLIAPTCDNFARNLIVPLVKSIKPTLYSQEQKVRISGFFLLPRLFEQNVNYDPQLYKARSYLTLSELDYFLADYNTDKWKGRPIDLAWLIDGYNSDGEFLGGIENSFGYLAEALATLVVDRPIANTSGSPSGGGLDIEDERRFYSSFGISNLNFPLTELMREFESRVKKQFFETILSEKKAKRNEVEPDVRETFDSSLHIEDLPSELKRDEYHRQLREEFPEIDKELDVRPYISKLEETASEYESNYRSDQQELQKRSEEIAQDMIAKIQEKVEERINSHRNRINYSLAFCDVLLGQGRDSKYIEGRGWEEVSSLGSYRKRYENKLQDSLDVSQYEQRLDELKEEVNKIQEKISDLRNQAENDGKGKGKLEQSTADKISRLKSKLGSKKTRKTSLEEDLTWFKENQNEEGIRFKLLKKRRESTINILEGELEEKSNDLDNQREELEELFERRREIFKTLFLKVPIPLVLIVATTSYYFFSEFLASSHLTGASFFLYLFFASLFYYQGIREDIRDKQTTISNLEDDIRVLKTKVHTKYRDYFAERIKVQIFDSSREIVQTLEEKIERLRNHIASFVEQSREEYHRSQEREASLPRSIFEVSVVPDDILDSFFKNLCKKPEKGINQFLNIDEKPFSDYVVGENGFANLLNELYDLSQELGGRLADTTAEEVLFDHLPNWMDERLPANYIRTIYPVSPYASLKQNATMEEINLLGVANKNNTRIDGFMEEQGLAPKPEFFSHFRDTKITIMKLLYYFSLKDLKQFKSFTSSYKTFLSNDGSAEELFPPQFSKEKLDEIKLKENEGLIRLIVLGLGLSIITRNEEGLYYQEEKLGETVEQVKEGLSRLDMEEIKTEIESEIEMGLTWESEEEKQDLKRELNNFDIPVELGDVASEIIQNELSRLEKIS